MERQLKYWDYFQFYITIYSGLFLYFVVIELWDSHLVCIVRQFLEDLRRTSSTGFAVAIVSLIDLLLYIFVL